MCIYIYIYMTPPLPRRPARSGARWSSSSPRRRSGCAAAGPRVGRTKLSPYAGPSAGTEVSRLVSSGYRYAQSPY